MGVYIKGMGIPTSCRACHLKMNCDDCEGWECVCVPLHQKIGYIDDLLVDKRRDDCPLVSVPSHGDLIDRDALMKDGWLSLWKRVNYMGGYAIHDLPLINPTIPVIIEAEVDE